MFIGVDAVEFRGYLDHKYELSAIYAELGHREIYIFNTGFMVIVYYVVYI